MSPEAHLRLVELDALSREGRDFYQHAAAVLPDSPLRECCLRLARTKAELVVLLAQRLRGGRDPRLAPAPVTADGGRLGVSYTGDVGYGGARKGLKAGDAPALSKELLRIEAAVVGTSDARARDSDDIDCRRALAWALPVLRLGLEQLQAGGAPPRLH